MSPLDRYILGILAKGPLTGAHLVRHLRSFRFSRGFPNVSVEDFMARLYELRAAKKITCTGQGAQGVWSCP